MHYIFGIFKSLQINYVCDNFRPHGTFAKTALLQNRPLVSSRELKGWPSKVRKQPVKQAKQPIEAMVLRDGHLADP